jgi:hypothetical protein
LPKSPVKNYKATTITPENAKEKQLKSAATRQKNRQKIYGSVKESVSMVFERLGGVVGYAEWAKENPDKFYDHYIKILPVEMKAEVNVTTDFTNILESARQRALPQEDIIEGIATTMATLAEEHRDA